MASPSLMMMVVAVVMMVVVVVLDRTWHSGLNHK